MKNQTLFVGIDVSKLKHDIALMSHSKKLVGQPFVIKDDLAFIIKSSFIAHSDVKIIFPALSPNHVASLYQTNDFCPG